DDFVSSATLEADGKLVESKGCTIEGRTTSAGGKLTFERLDERLSFPIPEEARSATSIDATPLALSQYTLKVTGLKQGNYAVRIDGVLAATVKGAALAEGVNLSELGPQPVAKVISPIIA